MHVLIYRLLLWRSKLLSSYLLFPHLSKSSVGFVIILYPVFPLYYWLFTVLYGQLVMLFMQKYNLHRLYLPFL